VKFKKILVIGLGYVGITLAVTLAKKGYDVFGYDVNKKLVESLEKKELHLYEPGVMEFIKDHYGNNFRASTSLKNDKYDVIILCVSTPVDFSSERPDLSNLKKAVLDIHDIINDETLVVVRSTVPIGTTKNLVYPTLMESNRKIYVAFCPERTIQGIALKEIIELPQIIGGIDEKSAARASEFFSEISNKTIKVSSAEAAEMIKLINNCHTDLIYSFGNEVALMAEKFNLDAYELINAANLEYPRPDINKPGFVGGGCLSKDPYILINSFAKYGYIPKLVLTARKLNEKLPAHLANNVIINLRKINKKLESCKIFICGFAYKGQPITDDIRGSPAPPFMEVLKSKVGKIYGHDFLVNPQKIKSFGVNITDLNSGFKGADCVIFLNNHPKYKELKIIDLIKTMRKPALIYDVWRLFDKDKINSVGGVEYHSIGV